MNEPSRVRLNGSERVQWARGHCEATGMHHADCPGTDLGRWDFVIHHVYRRGHTPPGVDRDATEHLRYVWNGPTRLGAGGCHGRLHSHQREAAELGLLYIDRSAYCKTCGGTSTHWKGCQAA